MVQLPSVPIRVAAPNASAVVKDQDGNGLAKVEVDVTVNLNLQQPEPALPGRENTEAPAITGQQGSSTDTHSQQNVEENDNASFIKDLKKKIVQLQRANAKKQRRIDEMEQFMEALRDRIAYGGL
jgi:hypothetical protein